MTLEKRVLILAGAVQASKLAVEEPSEFQRFRDRSFDFVIRDQWDFVFLYSTFTGKTFTKDWKKQVQPNDLQC